MNDATRKLLAAIQRVRLVHDRMEMQDLEVLLTVATNPGISIVELQGKATVKSSSASRSAYRLSPEERIGKPGLGLIKISIDRADRRRRELTLLPKGERLMAQIESDLL